MLWRWAGLGSARLGSTWKLSCERERPSSPLPPFSLFACGLRHNELVWGLGQAFLHQVPIKYLGGYCIGL